MKIVDVRARQIFDCRGIPTVEADIVLDGGIKCTASVPSGFVGHKDACELRDNNASLLGGKSVFRAVENIKAIIRPALIGQNVANQTDIDQLMVDIDGTDNKEKLGVNAILPVSLAVAKAAGLINGQGLYRYIGGLWGSLLPVPLISLVSGGIYGSGGLDIKEIMIMPVKGDSFARALAIGAEVCYSFRALLQEKGLHFIIDDTNGGFILDVDTIHDAMGLVMSAIERSGHRPGQDVLIAMDSDADRMYDVSSSKYIMKKEYKTLAADEMIDMCYELMRAYPIFSIEDPLSEQDEGGFMSIMKSLGSYVQILSGNLFASNPYVLQDLIPKKMANAILIKPNQIGTISEMLMVVDLARNNGYGTVFSHRSGETSDMALAHLAVGLRAGQVKMGSVYAGRNEKYNELIRIEESLGSEAVFAGQRILQQFARFRNNLLGRTDV